MIPSDGLCDATRIGETRDTIGVLYEQGGCSLVLGMVEAADVLAHGRVPPPPPPPPPVRPGPVISPGLSRVEVKLAMPTQLGNTTHGKAQRTRLSQTCPQGANRPRVCTGPDCWLRPLLLRRGEDELILQRSTSLGAPHTADWCAARHATQ